jgi:hypothetical protein
MIRLNPTGYRYDINNREMEPEHYLWARSIAVQHGILQPFVGRTGLGPMYSTRERWANPPWLPRYGIQLFRMWQRIVRDIIHQSYPARVWRLLRIKLPREIVNLIQYSPPIRLLIGPPVLRP